ncbi:MAG: hypothetical protein HY553_13015 [Elusimicrobia bacterium]|nr:hypothetical protein [Elusimicrobiota bacterium]
MKRSRWCIALAAVLVACGEETRNGQLTLAGSTPLRIADQDGRTVEFFTGPLKVEFGPDGSRKVSVKLEQEGRVAKFSARVSGRNADWNFTIRGNEIGQSVDLASTRKVEYYGPRENRLGNGGSCGYNGTWVTEETWQRGNEDWKVAFTEAANGSAVGAFASRREGEYYLLEVRHLWCRERRDFPEPRIPRWDRVSHSIERLQETGVRFD